MAQIPAVVSKRNHFRVADELTEAALLRLPDEYKHPEFGRWLLRYTETVIKSVASDFSTAAARGIEQAANLLCDPDFYEMKRERRSRERRDWREQRAKEEQERLERQHFPTETQLEQERAGLERQLLYHQQQCANYERKLADAAKKLPTPAVTLGLQ